MTSRQTRAAVGCALALALAASLPLQAAPVADSIAEFSSTQGLDGWSYGYFNHTANGAYSAAAFTEFAVFDGGESRWKASAAQVGANNNVYLSIDMLGGHPNGIGPDSQDASIWAVRRYTSEVAGTVRVDFDLRKINVSNTNAGGITGHIFVDGLEVLSQFIGNADGVGVQDSLYLDVGVGTLIDFAIDPLGLATSSDGRESARADGSHFSAVIEPDTRPLPLPGTALLLLLAGCGLLLRRPCSLPPPR